MKTAYLHTCPIQIGLHSQKLIFKAKIIGGGGPVGVRPPKNRIFSILWKDYINLNLKNKLTICFGPTYFFSKLPKIFFLRLQDMCIPNALHIQLQKNWQMRQVILCMQSFHKFLNTSKDVNHSHIPKIKYLRRNILCKIE